MIDWLPNIENPTQPLYIEIADAIENSISSGELAVGAKLPPLRNIAFDIGVTVGTVSRAYALACERGLVSGEVGRGTYILSKDTPNIPNISPPSEMAGATLAQATGRKVINLGYSSAINVGQSKTIAAIASTIARDYPDSIMDYVRQIPAEWRTAGQTWLSSNGWKAELENVVPTNGAHAAIISIITSVTAPGDKIAVEGLTYCSVARSIKLLGRRLADVAFDEFGIIPEAFERLCAQQHPKLLYMMPSVQNPTLARLSAERRKQIAEIAHRFNVYIIDDAIYAPLVSDDLLPMAHYLPDRTFTVGGLSKSVSAGIRAGWAACPPRYATRIANAHKMMTGGASYWLTELASNLVLTGKADEIRNAIKNEIRERIYIARLHLSEHQYKFHETCPYIWLNLPEPWLSGTFKRALEDQNIVISGEDEFKPERSDVNYHSVRLGVTSVDQKEELNPPFKLIASLLESGLSGFDNHG